MPGWIVIKLTVTYTLIFQYALAPGSTLQNPESYACIQDVFAKTLRQIIRYLVGMLTS